MCVVRESGSSLARIMTGSALRWQRRRGPAFRNPRQQLRTPKASPAAACGLRRGSRDALTQNAHRPGGEHAASHQSEGAPRLLEDATVPKWSGKCGCADCAGAHRRTHQIGAHGALCQHERAFGHQENLDVGETRGLLLVLILLRVVGAAPLCADLVFNLHPAAQAPLGPDGVEMCASSMPETICSEREAALQSIVSLGRKVQALIVASTPHYAQPVRVGCISLNRAA